MTAINEKINVKMMKIAIVGFGGMGDNHRKYIIKRLNDSDYPVKLDIAGVYDIDEERKRYAESLGLHNYASAEELLADRGVDIVLIATPNDLHLPYVKAAAAAGKHIIVEKPAGMDLAEVKEMYAVTAKAGVVFSPHQNRRWDDDFLSAAAVAKSGEIGRVYRVESRVMGSNGIPGAWRRVAAKGGGMMLDWGVHLVDQALSFRGGEKVKSIYCNYSYEAGEEVDDGFDLSLEFSGGLMYRIVVDTNSFVELPRWMVYGEDGTAAVTEWRNMRVEGEVVRVTRRVDERLQGVNAGNGFTKTMARRLSDTVERRPITVKCGDKNAFYANFMNAITKGVPTIVTEEEEIRLFRVMEAAKRSALTGEAIKGSF